MKNEGRKDGRFAEQGATLLQLSLELELGSWELFGYQVQLKGTFTGKSKGIHSLCSNGSSHDDI